MILRPSLFPVVALTTATLLAALFQTSVAVAQGPPPAQIRYTVARQQSVRDSIGLTGTIESRRSSLVASEVEGIVDQLVAREGDHVARRDPLVRLRSTTVRLRLEAVRGQLEEAQARQTLAKTSLERSRGLFQEKIISQQQLDDAMSEYEAWQGRVAQLEADVSRLEDDLERTTVRAPFAGVVVKEHVAEGEWIASGGPVVEIVDLQDLEVTVAVPEGTYYGLEVGSGARVVIPALHNRELEGRIRAVVPRADSRARTFPVKVAIANDDGEVAVGMLAQVYLAVGEARDRVVVPKDAIVEQGRQKVVFRIREDGTAERVVVEPGSTEGVWVAIEGGIDAGDQIITRGNERVFPGQPVTGEALEYPQP